MVKASVNGVPLDECYVKFESVTRVLDKRTDWILIGFETSPVAFTRNLRGLFSCFAEIEGRSVLIELVGSEVEEGERARHTFKGEEPFPFTDAEWSELLRNRAH
jgi:hypothetical protein